MKLLLLLFSFEHLFLCFPIFVLSYNITNRNIFLNQFFTILPDEAYSTAVAYTIAVIMPIIFAILPFIQYKLFIMFHQTSKPWSRIFNKHCKTVDSIDSEKNLRKVTEVKMNLEVYANQNNIVETYFHNFWSNVVDEKRIKMQA